MRGGNGVAKVFDDVENLCLLLSAYLLHHGLILILAVLETITLRLVCLAQSELSFTVAGFVEADEGAENAKPDTGQPALACPTRHLFEIESIQELYFDQYRKVIEEPVEGKCDTA